MGLGVGRLDQMLLDDAIAEAIAPDVILQVSELATYPVLVPSLRCFRQKEMPGIRCCCPSN